MKTLPWTASADEFPAPPRRVVVRPLVWFARGGVVVSVCLALIFSLPFTQDRIKKAEQLLRNSKETQAEITDLKVRSQKGEDDLNVTFLAETAEGDIEGTYTTSIDDLGSTRVGDKIPIWYSPDNVEAYRRFPPTEEWLEARRGNQTILVFGLIGLGILGMSILQFFISRESKFARFGSAIQASYNVTKKEARGHFEYQIRWTFLDTQGEKQFINELTYSESKLPRSKDGTQAILVHSHYWTHYLGWYRFRWIDIIVD